VVALGFVWILPTSCLQALSTSTLTRLQGSTIQQILLCRFHDLSGIVSVQIGTSVLEADLIPI